MHTETDVFAAFEAGSLILPAGKRDFAGLPWNPHPAFSGVCLKHLVTAADTDGKFSCHLVRIDPGCAIGSHVHQTQLETHEVISGDGISLNDGVETAYRPGMMSMFGVNVPHEVRAGKEGLRLFAKFIPALC